MIKFIFFLRLARLTRLADLHVALSADRFTYMPPHRAHAATKDLEHAFQQAAQADSKVADHVSSCVHDSFVQETPRPGPVASASMFNYTKPREDGVGFIRLRATKTDGSAEATAWSSKFRCFQVLRETLRLPTCSVVLIQSGAWDPLWCFKNTQRGRLSKVDLMLH